MIEHRYESRQNNPNIWAWVVLLPVFFVLGWLANSYWSANGNQYVPQAGVGGGPGPDSPYVSANPSPSTIIRLTPRSTPTISPVAPTLQYQQMTVTPY